MNAYEITFIVRPDLEEEQIRGVVDQVGSRLESVGAEIIAVVPWTPPRRRMAYPIREYGDGCYVTTTFRIDSTHIREFENALKLNDNILRFLVVQASDVAIKQAQNRVHQMQMAAAAPPPPRPVAATHGPPLEAEQPTDTESVATEPATAPSSPGEAEAEVLPVTDQATPGEEPEALPVPESPESAPPEVAEPAVAEAAQESDASAADSSADSKEESVVETVTPKPRRTRKAAQPEGAEVPVAEGGDEAVAETPKPKRTRRTAAVTENDKATEGEPVAVSTTSAAEEE